MKKFFLSSFLSLISMMMFAQLPYGTKLTETNFKNGDVIAKSSDCKWLLGSIDLGNGLAYIPLINPDPADNSCTILLPSIGLPKQVDFQYRSLSKGTVSVEESADMSTWTKIWSQDVETELIKAVPVTANLSPSARFVRLHFVGFMNVYFSEIQFTELKELRTSIDSWQFKQAKVDDPVETKEVNVTWTNISALVASTNPAFTVSTPTIGQKNLIEQTTKLVITYHHDNYGEHTGEIIIEGEGCRAVIAVSGITTRDPQTLYWDAEDNLGTFETTSNVTFDAFTNRSLPVSYACSDSTIAEVDFSGNVIVKCSGTVEFTAFQPGTRQYEPSNEITKTITFVKANPGVAIVAEDIVYGQPLSAVQLHVSDGDVEGTVTYRDNDPSDILDAGDYVLPVVFVPDDTCMYNSVERMVWLTVNKASQTIDWNPEQTVLYVGETIDLNATASSELPVTYAISSCKVVMNGSKMTGAEEGDVLVIAYQEGDDNYLPTTVVLQAFEVVAESTPTAERVAEADPSIDELEANGQKYYHNGQTYIYYRGRIYTTDGKRIK